jgi:uncharacterized protein
VASKVLSAAKIKLHVDVPGTGAPQDLRCRMDKTGIANSVLLPLAKGKAAVSPLNDWILSVCGNGLIPFGAVHPLMENLENELDRLKAHGILGVKMMPLLQEFFPDSAQCRRLYETLIERKMILVTHSGRDPVDREEIFGTPKRFANTIDCYPDLKLELAHLGGLRMWDEVRKYILPAGRNVYFDTAYVSFYMKENEMADLIGDIGANRVLFGSDYPWEDPGLAARIIKSLELSSREKEAILWRNAAQILDLSTA